MVNIERTKQRLQTPHSSYYNEILQEVIYQLGDLYDQANNWRKAIRALEDCNSRALSDPGILARLGQVYFHFLYT